MKVSIELLDVTCHDTENVTRRDKFYILSVFTAGTELIQVNLTTPMHINEHATMYFDAAEQVLFTAAVPHDQPVRGGLIAFDADFTTDWRRRAAWMAIMEEQVSKSIQISAQITGTRPIRAARVLASAVHCWQLLAPKIAEDDELGQMTFDSIPAQGPPAQSFPWSFQWMRSTWSNWGYTVHCKISRQ